MKGQDDPTLSRDTRLGLYMFLYSEIKRHEMDIVMIRRSLNTLANELGLDCQNKIDISKKAMKYVEFD
jgi:hypothetical protein